jgi:hypothetical protein
MKMKLSLQNDMMTNCNKAIFCWGLFLTLLTFAHSLVSFLDKLIITDDMQSVELQI